VYSKAELLKFAGKTVPDVIAEDLMVLFVGINPGLYSAATGHHFARPGNRFWPALFRAGLTPRLLKPEEERELLALGYGITNVVARASAGADEITLAELAAGGTLLLEKIARFRPGKVAFLGIGAFRAAFARPQAALGRQPEPVAGSEAWVLPNPSGLNAHYTLDALAHLFSSLR
jgi:double-stranded uracil-DNA glycosylase